jgi:putative ABC transport system ATP-binding protein
MRVLAGSSPEFAWEKAPRVNAPSVSPATRHDAPAAPLLRVADLRKTYATPQGPLPVLQGVTFSLAAGETLALLGESGSGKSTLLHLVGALDDVDGGAVFLDGVDLTRLTESARAAARRARIGVVFQQFNLVASLTVAENLAFQAQLAGRYDAEWQTRLTRRLGLETLVSRYPEQLSGGQQQRVAIGRALAVRPRILLADEPTGNLDEATSDAVMALTLELVAETGCAFLMATHSARLAARLHRRAYLEAGTLAPA